MGSAPWDGRTTAPVGGTSSRGLARGHLVPLSPLGLISVSKVPDLEDLEGLDVLSQVLITPNTPQSKAFCF